MKKTISRSFITCQVILVFLLLLSSCQKNPLEIGLNLIPSSDTLQVTTTDTTSIVAYTVPIDSVRTDETSSIFLGSKSDPVFGKTTVGFCTQFDVAQEAFSFGTTPVWDSLVLCLAYSGGYSGDTTAPMTVKVYEMTEALEVDSSYYSNRSFQHDATELANVTFHPHPLKKVIMGSDTLSPHLRINLSNLTPVLADKIIQASADNLLNSTNFKDYMKGLCVVTEPITQGGCLVTFGPLQVYSRLSIYYHNSGSNGDSLRFDFPIASDCARFMNIDHNGYQDASSDFKNQVFNHDTTLGKQKVYIQPMAGVKTKISFPHIMDYYKKGKIAINEARLILKNYDPSDTTVPASLAFVKFNKEGLVGYVVDELEGETYFHGTYDKTNHEYYFRITRHLQKVLEGYYDTPYDLYLLADSPMKKVVTLDGIVLNGTSPGASIAPEERMQLKIIYTRLY